MSPLEATVEELKSLPPAKLAEAVDYIHRLKVAGSQAGKRKRNSSGFARKPVSSLMLMSSGSFFHRRASDTSRP